MITDFTQQDDEWLKRKLEEASRQNADTHRDFFVDWTSSADSEKKPDDFNVRDFP